MSRHPPERLLQISAIEGIVKKPLLRDRLPDAFAGVMDPLFAEGLDIKGTQGTKAGNAVWTLSNWTASRYVTS